MTEWGGPRGGTHIDWTNRNDKIDRALEIFFMHGQSELYDPRWELSYENQRDPYSGADSQAVSVHGPHYARDGWALGQRLAVTASTDNHSSKPGLRHGGLTGVWAPELTRESIWDSIYNKNVYGTTGERIALEFSIDGTGMGQNVTTAGNPHVRVTVAGTDDIVHLEIVRLDLSTKAYKTIYKRNPNSFLADVDYQDETFTGDAMYYVRARQKTPVRNREVWAWSTPIWVKRLP